MCAIMVKSMEVENKNVAEKQDDVARLVEVFDRMSPDDVIDKFTPTNAVAAKQEFLANDTLRRPNNEYGNLTAESLTVLAQDLATASGLIEAAAMNGIVKKIYEDEIGHYGETLDFLMTAKQVQDNPDDVAGGGITEYMRLNEKLYGVPDEKVYRALLAEKMSKISVGALDERCRQIWEELNERVRFDPSDVGDKFVPRADTVKFMGEMVRDFYGDLLKFVPEDPKNGDKFVASEVKQVFGDILSYLQEDSGFDERWKVVDKKSGAINVSASDKAIYVPEDRKPMSRSELEGLVVHEIGTHVYRAEIGEQMGVKPLAQGMTGYLDTEEGVAKVMEAAVKDRYVEAGVDLYLTAGMAYCENMDFRDVFETNWRMILLASDKSDFSDEAIGKAKNTAYVRTQRIFRGTDTLPWFKDLSYYNGGTDVWRYIEKELDKDGGTATLFDELFLGGKNNVFDVEQQRAVSSVTWGGAKSGAL